MDSKGLRYIWSPVGDAIHVSDAHYFYPMMNSVDRSRLTVTSISPATLARSAENTTTSRYCHVGHNN